MKVTNEQPGEEVYGAGSGMERFLSPWSLGCATLLVSECVPNPEAPRTPSFGVCVEAPLHGQACLIPDHWRLAVSPAPPPPGRSEVRSGAESSPGNQPPSSESHLTGVNPGKAERGLL